MPRISSSLKREELLKYISIYQLNPYVFEQEDVDVLYETAKDRGIPFERDPKHVESSIMDKVGQLTSGFVSGFSTFHVGEDPETTGEAIARNVGHLFGFMGVIPGVGTVGSLLAKSTVMGARGLKAAKLISDVKKVEKTTEALHRFTSVPMGISKALVGKVGGMGKVKAIGETSKYLKAGTVARDVVTQAAELGIGSGIASWQGGIDEMIDATLMGTGTGAVFGVLSNVQLQGMGDILKVRQMFKSPATLERANIIARTALMAGYTGLPSTAAGDPIEMQVYQYGLGAFFGVKSIPASVRSAGEFIRHIEAGERMNPERADGFKALNKPVQKEVLRQAALMWGRRIKGADEAAEEATWGSILLAQTFPKILPGEKYDKASVNEILEVKNKAKRIAQDLENGIDTFPSENLVEVRPKAEPTFKPESLYSRMDNWLEKEAAAKKGKKFSKKEQLELQKEHKQIAEDLSLGDSMPSLSNWISGKFESFKDRMLKKYGNTDIKNQTAEEILEFTELRLMKDNADYFINMALKKPKKPKSEQLDMFRQHAVITKEMKDGKVEIQYRDGTKETIDAERLKTMGGEKMTEEIAKELAGATKADVDSETASKDVVFDHEDSVARIDDPLQKFLADAIQPEHNIKEVKERVNKATDEILEYGGENAFPQFEDILRETLGEQSYGSLTQHRTNLKRWWKQKAQYKLGKQTYWDGYKIVSFGTIDPNGTRIVEKRTESLYEMVSTKARRAMSFFTSYNPKTKRRMTYDIFGANYDGSSLLGRNDFAKIFMAADKDNYYVVSGVKDKQRAILHPYAFKTINETRFRLKGFFRGTKKYAPELESIYNSKKEEFVNLLTKNGGDKGKSGKIYEKVVASNVEYLERINGGLPIEVILDPANKGKFITDVMSLNKRTQLIDAGELWWNPAEHRTEADPTMNGIKIALVNGIPEGFSQTVRGQLPIKAFKKLAEHHTDGIFILDQTIFDNVIKDGGFPADASILKGTLRHANPEQGLILGKYAYFRAGDGTHAEMQRHGLHGMLWDSAAKQTGLRNKVNVQVSSDASGVRKMSFYKPGKSVSNAIKADFTKEDGHFIGFGGLTLNPTVFESPSKLMKDTRAVRQAFTQLKPEQIVGEYKEKHIVDALAEDILGPAYRGTEESTKFVADYFSAVKSKDLNKIAEMDVKLEDVNMEDIGIEQKLTVLFGKEPAPAKLYSKMWEHILKLDNKNEIDLDLELFTETDVAAKQDYINTKRQTFSTVHRWLKIARDNGGITPLFMNHRIVRRYAENVFKNYMTSSLIRPVMEHSGKAVGTPYDPMLQARFKREKGHFYLGDSWKSKKIKWGNGETTLEKAFEDYQRVKGRYDKLSDKEKRSDKNVLKNQLDSMVDDLSWAIIRVPSDSVSGTRILKFGGFFGRKGAGILLNNEDMIALGGMDLDIDSVFLYQHFSKDPVLNKKLFKQIRNNKDEWIKNNELMEVKADSRKAELNIKERTYEDSPGGYSKRLSDLFDPSARWDVAQGAASGNQRIGSAANLSRRLGTFYTLLEKYGKKVVTGVGVDFDYKLNSDKGFLLRLFGRDAMNWAADAGNTAGVYSHPQLESVMLKKMFSGKAKDTKILFSKGKKVKNSTNLEKRDFAKQLKKTTVYGILKRMDDALNGRDWKNNRSFTLIESLRELDAAKTELQKLDIELPGVWYKAADRLANLFEQVDKSNFSFINDKASFRLNKIFDRVVSSDAGQFVLASTFRHRIKVATDPPNLVELSKMHGDIRREVWKDLITQDKWDMLSAIMLTKTARAYKESGGELKDLENIANQAEKYLQEYNGILKLETEKKKAGKEPRRFESMEKLYNSMVAYKEKLGNSLEKEYFESYLASSLVKQDVTLEKARELAQKKVDDSFDAKSRSDAEAELALVDKHWWRTNMTRLGLADSRVISERVMTDYIINYNRLGKMADKELTDAEVKDAVKEALGIPVVGANPEKAKIITESKKLNNAIENETFTSDFLNKIKDLKKLKIEGRGVTPEVKEELSTLKRQLTWIFAKHPDLADKFFPSKFVGVSGKPDRGILKQIPSLPESATLQDVRDFIGFYKLRYGRLFETDMSPEKMKDMPVLRRHFMMWHSTVGQKLEKADMKWYPLRNVLVKGPGGKPFNTEARIPISTLGMQDVVANKVILLKDAAERTVHSRIRDTFGYVDKIGHEGDRLFELATDLHQEKLYDRSKERRLFRVNADKARKTLETKFKGKKYLVPVGEKTVKMSAEEVVLKIRRDIRKFTEDFYKERVNDRSGEADKKYLIWKDKENGELDFEATMRNLAEPMLQGIDPPMAPLNTMLRIAYERAIQIVLAPERPPEYLPNNTKKERETIRADWEKDLSEGIIKRIRVVDNPDKNTRSRLLDYLKARDTGLPWDGGISKVQEGYFPRGGHIKKEVEEYIEKRIRDAKKKGATDAEVESLVLRLRTEQAESLVEDGLLSRGSLEIAMREDISLADLETMGIFSRPGHALKRGEEPIPNWDKSRGALYRYSSQMISAYYNNLFALMSHRMIEKFEKDSPLGEHTKDWKMFMQNYTMNVLGYPSVFPKEWLDRPSFPIKETPYYWMSDHLIHKKLDKVSNKYFNGKKFWKDGDATDMSRKLAAFSNFDAKYQLMSLLSHTKTMIANMFGGTETTIASTGWRYWKDAGSLDHLKRVIPDVPQGAGWDWFQKFAEEAGAVESFFVNELRFSPHSKSARTKKYFGALRKKWNKEGKFAKMSVGEIGKEFGVHDSVINFAAQAMRWSERKLRSRAFWAHYLKWADVFDMHAISRDAKHPWIMQLALRGVENTQFLYHNAARPAFARTNLGRVYARFQTWAWNSMKFRKDIYKNAKAYGFRPGSEEMEQFRRIATGDLFIFSLASAFPFSMFDSALPPPMSYVMDFSELMFGDERTRDRAFFGTLPGPLAPIQAISPPSARFILGPLGSMLKGDWDRWATYQIYTWFPFGRVLRDIAKTVDNPSMAIERLTGFPIFKLQREVKERRELETLKPGGVLSLEPMKKLSRRSKYREEMKDLDPWEIPVDYEEWESSYRAR